MTMMTFNDHGEYISSRCVPEQGPLRPSDVTAKESLDMPPCWAYGDHGPLPYVLRADHRSITGRIVSRGRRMLAERRRSVVTLTDPDDESCIVVLNGDRWCVPAEGAPMLSADEYPDLFLPA